MDSFTEKMFEFQRRATQTVLEKMGAVDKTHDEVLDNNLSNFKRLGEFMNHLEETTQQSMLNMEKMCQTNSALATSMCNFILSELSDEKEYSTGLLSKFFKRTAPESGDLSIRFQDSVQRLYDSFGTIGHDNLRKTIESLDGTVVVPFKRDKEMNKITKQVLEKRKKLNLDYDSVKRSSSDMDKVRMAKEEFEQASKNTNNHVQTRSFIRCKLIVHSIVSLVQQFCIFFESNSLLLEGLLEFIEPLLDTYQLGVPELVDIYRPKKATPSTPPPNNNRPGSPTPPPVYPSPPPSYKESVSNGARPRSSSGSQSNLSGQFRNMNMNDNSNNNGPTSPSSTSSYNSDESSPQTTTQSAGRNEKLFSVWDDDSHNNHNSSSNSNSNNNSGNNSNSNSKSKDNYEDWMYDTPKDTSSTVKPQTSTPTTGQYDFKSPPQQQQQSQQYQQQQQQQYSQNGTYNPPSYQPQPPQQQQQQQQSQQYQQQQQQPMNQKKTSYNDIFGDFDFLNPNTPNQTPGTGSTGFPGGPTPSAGGQDFSYFMRGSQPPPSMNFSPHVDHKSQSERETLEPGISEKIRQWAEGANGKKNDIRVLLSTLHEVLWDGSGWEKVNRGQMVAPTQVKKVYRKAIMVVHPDKVNLGSTEQKIIAQRIFERLRDEFEILRVRDLEPNSQ